MLFRAHLAFGVFLFLILFSFVEIWWLFLVGVLVGVLIVDLDSRKSKVGNYFIFRPFQFFVKHRGFMHSLLFGSVVMAVFAMFSVNVAFGFIVGFLSHLFLDCLTRRGVALFWPISKKRLSFILKSGGLVEDVVFVLLLLIDIGLVVKLFL